MMLFAAATARSLLEPTIKLSIVYLLLRPLVDSERFLIGLISLIKPPVVISRGRTLDLELDFTSKSTDQ